MRRISSLAVAAISAFTFAALGTGMQSASAAPAGSTFNWSGAYVGLNAGGVWGTNSSSYSSGSATWFGAPGAAIVSAGGSQGFNNSGFTGGAQIGINWQNNNIVWGLEAEFDYFNPKGSTTVNFPLGVITATTTATLNQSTSANWLFTARPRVGFAMNNWLLYGTGGIAVANLKFTDTFNSSSAGGLGSESASASKTKAGYVVGGGVEVALGNKMSVRAEYLYLNFNSVSGSGTFCAPLPACTFTGPYTQSHDFKENIARIAVNWKL